MLSLRVLWLDAIVAALVTTVACGGEPPKDATQVPPPPSHPEPQPSPEDQRARVALVFSEPGQVGITAISKSSIYAIIGGGAPSRHRQAPVLHIIDRQTRRVRSVEVGDDTEIFRVDPLILYRHEQVTRLSDRLEPAWTSPRVKLWGLSDCWAGRLLVVRVDQGMGQTTLGLDAQTGAERFRVPTAVPWSGGNRNIQTGATVVVHDGKQLVFVDGASGKVGATVPATRPQYEVIGERVVAQTSGGLAAYDTSGRELWTHAGSFYIESPGLRCPEEPPTEARSTYVAYQDGRGYVGIDVKTGKEKWLVKVETAEGKDGTQAPSSSWVQPGGLFVHNAAGSRIIDTDTGATLFECKGCVALSIDGDDVLVQTKTKSGDQVQLTLQSRSGKARWAQPISFPTPKEHGFMIEGFMERPHFSESGSAVLPSIVALCPPGGPITFVDRASGATLAVENLPTRPDREESRSGRCELTHRDGTVVVETEQGAAVFETFATAQLGKARPPASGLKRNPEEGEPVVAEVCACTTSKCLRESSEKIHPRVDDEQIERIRKCATDTVTKEMEVYVTETCACKNLDCVDEVRKNRAGIIDLSGGSRDTDQHKRRDECVGRLIKKDPKARKSSKRSKPAR